MPMSTPYEQHWRNLAAWQPHFVSGDLVAITVATADARSFDEGITDQQAREALRILATDTEALTDMLNRHMPRAIQQARRENPSET